MEINIYGTLRSITGTKTVRIDLPDGSTLSDLLLAFIHQYPAMQAEMMDEQGVLRPDLPMFINGRNPRLFPNWTHRLLQPGDVLSLFSPVSSGRLNVEDLRDA